MVIETRRALPFPAATDVVACLSRKSRASKRLSSQHQVSAYAVASLFPVSRLPNRLPLLPVSHVSWTGNKPVATCLHPLHPHAAAAAHGHKNRKLKITGFYFSSSCFGETVTGRPFLLFSVVQVH